MGIGASFHRRTVLPTTKEIYVDDGHNRVHKVIISSGMPATQLEEILATTTGCDRNLPIILMRSDGLLVGLHPVSAVPANDASRPYKVQIVYDNSAHKQLTTNISKMFQEISDIRTILQLHKSLTDKFVIPAISDFHEFNVTDSVKESLRSPGFNMWDYKFNDLISMLEFMFNDVNTENQLNIVPATLRKWLLCIKENYRDVPFHNFRHGFAVAQMMYALTYMCQLPSFLSRFELTTLLIACICHDLDHPGLSNGYQITAKTELAMRYNDLSPLENHHCTMTFRILSQPELNIFFNSPVNEYRQARKLIIKLILATDMSKHKEILTKFDQAQENFSWNDDEHRLLLLQMIIKLCDLSNEARPVETADLWLDSLLQEYFAEGDLVRKEGHPVEPLMDRYTMNKPKAQIGFLKFVVIPMYESIANVLPPIKSHLVPKLETALEMYQEMDKQGDSESRRDTQPKVFTDRRVSSIRAARSRMQLHHPEGS